MGAFTDCLNSRPMGDAVVGEFGAKWRSNMALWSRGEPHPKREHNNRPVRRRRSAAKRKIRDAERRQKNIALLAAAVNRAFGG
jgi:hypothetical protein